MAQGVLWVFPRLQGQEVKHLRGYADAMQKRQEPFVLVLSQQEEKGTHMIVATNHPKAHAKDILVHLTKLLGGSGGGRQDFAQGRITEAEGLEKALRALPSEWPMTEI